MMKNPGPPPLVERIKALVFFVCMIVLWVIAYHATDQVLKGITLFSGVGFFMAILAMVFKDFDPNDSDSHGRKN
jgi:hypothetical protein